MLDKPPHIANANIAGAPLRYRWDEWSVTSAYQPADPALTARMATLSHRANVAMCTAMAEWVVWRFERLSTDTAPYEFLEAAWAAGVHTAYTRYVEFRDDDWRGVVRGPMRMSMEILVDLIWGLADTTPGENAAWMSNLAELVLPAPRPFQEWREACIGRLERFHPRPAPPGKIVFSDEIDIGSWVPRELFDLTVPFDPALTRSRIASFVATLDPRRNRYLHTPDEMREFPDFEGEPYQVTDADA